jgi:hypothetical protein
MAALPPHPLLLHARSTHPRPPGDGHHGPRHLKLALRPAKQLSLTEHYSIPVHYNQ